MNAPHLFAEWNRCRDWLLPAMVDDAEDEVMNELFLNRAQLWRGDGAAFVTQLTHFADEPIIVVWLGGGDMRGLLAMQPGIEAWARAQGAKAAWVNGRTGWARALRRTGFEQVGDELRKAL
jgi:hypothetical protein